MGEERDRQGGGATGYLIVTAAYWAFTLTDGALRTLVLLHLHGLGYAPFEIASMFLAYEALGVVTTLSGGWLGGRFGLKALLQAGLSLQVAACVGLAVVGPNLAAVLIAQGASGIAKDLTKTGAKSYVKFLVPESDSSLLLRWVAWLTGSKNALKGLGLFLGGVSLTTLGFESTLIAMAVLVAVALVLVAIQLSPRTGRSKSKSRWSHLIPNERRFLWLSTARAALFASRDAWFVLAVPIYLREQLAWSMWAVSGFLAVWVILYGVVQASVPRWLGPLVRMRGPALVPLVSGVLLIPLILTLWIGGERGPTGPTLVLGLAVYGALFAVASSLHSFFVVDWAKPEGVAQQVGFYYSANALGRLLGTLVSGFLYGSSAIGAVGLAKCVFASIVLVAFAALASLRLRASSVADEGS
ncbi:MAG: organoarsenical effux MFS transporter ArsJ [Planctomycetota bacterium]|jgi:hypothetical protein